MTAWIAADEPMTLDGAELAPTNVYRPIDTSVARAADELGLGTRRIERLPFDLSAAPASAGLRAIWRRPVAVG
jgi:hypothetical protein